MLFRSVPHCKALFSHPVISEAGLRSFPDHPSRSTKAEDSDKAHEMQRPSNKGPMALRSLLVKRVTPLIDGHALANDFVRSGRHCKWRNKFDVNDAQSISIDETNAIAHIIQALNSSLASGSSISITSSSILRWYCFSAARERPETPIPPFPANHIASLHAS